MYIVCICSGIPTLSRLIIKSAIPKVLMPISVIFTGEWPFNIVKALFLEMKLVFQKCQKNYRKLYFTLVLGHGGVRTSDIKQNFVNLKSALFRGNVYSRLNSTTNRLDYILHISLGFKVVK